MKCPYYNEECVKCEHSEVVEQFVKFAKRYCHTLGEQHRLVEAAKDFLNPVKTSFSSHLKQVIHDAAGPNDRLALHRVFRLV
jgi:hypothetical protein